MWCKHGILDSTYEKPDLCKFASERKYLSEEDHAMLHNASSEYNLLFNKTPSTWKTETVGIDIKGNSKPHHTETYPVTRAHNTIFKNEVNRLFQKGVLKKVSMWEWKRPTFIKPKKRKVHIFILFGRLTQIICRKPVQTQKNRYMMLKL